MRISRREFIRILLGATIFSVGIKGLAPLFRDLLSGSTEILPETEISEDEAINNPIPAEELRSLDYINTLVNLIPALFIMRPPDELSHYERMIQVRSEQSSNDLEQYQNAADELNSRAINATTLPFARLSQEERRALIDEDLRLLGAEEETAVQETIRDLVRLFLFTDAYLVAGYDGWPGSTRGLKAYRMPPAN